MALEIKFDSDYGEQTQDGVTTLHCVARLMDGVDELAKVLIQGIPLDPTEGEAYRDAKAQEAFKDIKTAGDVVSKPTLPDTSKWSTKITKAAVIE